MATLFFEGFNIKNTDSTPYLDDKYWSRPVNRFYPQLFFSSGLVEGKVVEAATQGNLSISGYFLDTNPPQYAMPLQLSGIPGLDSDQLYVSFRVRGLSFNDTINNPFPYNNKFLTFCDGDNEKLTIEIIQTTDEPIQGGTWVDPSRNSRNFMNSGIGILVKQSNTTVGLFDLRVADVGNYALSAYCSDSDGGFPGSSERAFHIITTEDNNYNTRYIHLEFLIDKINNIINVKLEGIDVLNGLSSYPYSKDANLSSINNINNLKFYNRGCTSITKPDAELYADNHLFGFEKYMSIDDLVIVNNSGYDPKIWIGPQTRIFHLTTEYYYGFQYNRDDWSTVSPDNIGNTAQVLNSRDGDNSYKYTEISGNILSVNLTNSKIMSETAYNNYIKNGIGGIRLFSDVRKTFLDSDFTNVYTTGDSSSLEDYTEIGNHYSVTKTSYNIKNSFIFNNPLTSVPWTTGDIIKKVPIYSGPIYVASGFAIKKL